MVPIYMIKYNDNKTFGLEKKSAWPFQWLSKGIGTLIEAYKKIETDQKLVIVGSGSFTDEYVTELKQLASDNPNIIFTGNQSGEVLAELYVQASIFIQPSESEGLSLALLEAMSRRLPFLSVIFENMEGSEMLVLSFKNDLQNNFQLSWIILS
jgi:glycosyltransferase involved in cell wall biosynthesis